jgi:hypothetical protein
VIIQSERDPRKTAWPRVFTDHSSPPICSFAYKAVPYASMLGSDVWGLLTGIFIHSFRSYYVARSRTCRAYKVTNLARPLALPVGAFGFASPLPPNHNRHPLRGAPPPQVISHTACRRLAPSRQCI